MIETLEMIGPMDIWTGKIFSSLNFFLTFSIILGGIIGAISKKLSISVFGVFLILVKIGIETNQFIFDSMMYLSLVIMLSIMGLQIWDFATGTNI